MKIIPTVMNKNNWTYKKLGEIASFASGSRPSGGVRLITQGVLSLGGEHIGRNGYIDLSTPKYVSEQYFKDNTKGHLKNGDILLCKDGALSGKVALVREELQNNSAMVNEHVFIIRTDLLYQPYLFNFLFSPIGQSELKARITGAAQGGINGTNLKTILIPIPPLAEQERIVAELDLLSSIIEKKKAQLKELDQLAQSIFYTMFGDPITNPKGWETKKLGEVATQKLSYGSGASAIQYNGKIRYVRITDIREDGDLNSDIVSPDTFDEKYLLNEGDILFARSGATVGKTFQYKSRFGKCIFAGYLIRMIPNIEIVLPSFIFAYTKSSYYRSFVSKAQNAVAQPNINAKQYGDLLVPVPPISLQQEFAEKVEAIERQKALIQQSIDEVQTLFDSRMDYWFG